MHSIMPVPLFATNFNGLARLCNQVIKSINQRKGRQCNQSNNNRRQNSPYQFQRSMMIKTLRYRLQIMMETHYNTSSLPQYQYLNNNQEKTNISVKVYNSFHIRCSRILKHLLPRHRCIGTYFTHIPYHRNHTFLFKTLCNTNQIRKKGA